MPPLRHLLDQCRTVALASGGVLPVGAELLAEDQVPLLIVGQPVRLVLRVSNDQDGSEDTESERHDTFDQEKPSIAKAIQPFSSPSVYARE